MTVIVDTGIIVALASKRDKYHHWCKTQAADLTFPFITCEAVLSEAFHLLMPLPGGMDTLLGFLEKGLIKVTFSYEDNSESIHNFLNKYADLPVSFADACLVMMAETTKQARIFTLDNDFNVYRTTTGKPLSLIYP